MEQEIKSAHNRYLKQKDGFSRKKSFMLFGKLTVKIPFGI